MKFSMRLYRRGDHYYVEFHRGKKKSLGTTDEARAKEVYKELKAEYLRGKLFPLESIRKCTLSQFKDQYIESRVGISKATIHIDTYALKSLIDVLGASLQMRLVTPAKIDEYKNSCLLRGVKPKSINTYLRHIKASLTYALDTGIIEKRPKIKMVPAGESLPRILSPDEIKNILAKAKETDTDLFHYLTFCLWTGARRSEAKNLKWQNVNIKNRVCALIGKGNRERIVPLLPAVIEILAPVKRDIGPVFAAGHADTYSHRAKAVMRSAGIEGHHLHDLRHTCATFMLKNGVPLPVVQQILGHSQIQTTMLYIRVLDELKQSEMQKLKFE